MWKLVCFSVWRESIFSWWVNSFGWSIIVCCSLVSGIPQIFVFACSVQGSFQIDSLLEINNKEIPRAELCVLPLLPSGKKSKCPFMNVTDVCEDTDSGDLADKTSFTNNTLSFVPSAQKFCGLSIFKEGFPFKPACVFHRDLSYQTEQDTKRGIALNALKSHIMF